MNETVSIKRVKVFRCKNTFIGYWESCGWFHVQSRDELNKENLQFAARSIEKSLALPYISKDELKAGDKWSACAADHHGRYILLGSVPLLIGIKLNCLPGIQKS